MNPLNVVVPFSVFSEYRARRARGAGAGGDAASETPDVQVVSPSHVDSGCVDIAPASGETALDTPGLTEPTTERIPS